MSLSESFYPYLGEYELIKEEETAMTVLAEREALKTDVLKLIPEFEWIRDEKIRDAALNVWVDAMQYGKWIPEDLDKIPFTLLLDPCPASFLTHTRAVTTVAFHSGETLNRFYPDKLTINMDILVAGAILHDVGKLIEYKRNDENKVVTSSCGKLLRHPFSGMGIAFNKGLPDEVLHMICMHAKEGNLGKRIPEAVIVHHADFTNFEPFH